MKILGIETSCDETAASIVEDGRKILTNVIVSSLPIHQKTGGIIPENAAREQLHYILPIIKEATRDMSFDAIAVTQGPGLIGSLLVGVEAAKALAWASGKRLIAVNHLYGHIYASWLGERTPQLPAVVLIASGGHTDLVYMEGSKDLISDSRFHKYDKRTLKPQHKLNYLGGTRDDAAGEAFDKTARLLGLPYPGGPSISNEARHGSEGKVILPRPMLGENNHDFSFSGFKTAVRTLVGKGGFETRDMAREIEEAITDVLVEKTIRAATELGTRSIIVGGGVVANYRLREKFTGQWKHDLFLPDPKLATDNAAMIGAAAHFQMNEVSPLEFEANSSLSLAN
jgi:N6-L-threonylcarbamoyladenine synthase